MRAASSAALAAKDFGVFFGPASGRDREAFLGVKGFPADAISVEADVRLDTVSGVGAASSRRSDAEEDRATEDGAGACTDDAGVSEGDFGVIEDDAGASGDDAGSSEDDAGAIGNDTWPSEADAVGREESALADKLADKLADGLANGLADEFADRVADAAI